MIFGLVVAIVFILSIFSFQVKSTETAVVTTFGEITPDGVKEAGWHFRWPNPVQKIHRFDNRSQCFEGNIGKLEETYTADGKNVIIGIFVIYRIVDPAKLLREVKTVETAEDQLNIFMRTRKDGVVGKHKFDEFINTNPQKMKLSAIEDEIKAGLKTQARDQLGLEIEYVGIKTLGLPEKISEKVFSRMNSERSVAAEEYRARGKMKADEIKAEANKERDKIVATATAEAKRIRAIGDARAAAHYAVFNEEPELAVFLRKLDSLRKTMAKKTTLILDTDSAPFDLLKMDSEKLKSIGSKAEKPKK